MNIEAGSIKYIPDNGQLFYMTYYSNGGSPLFQFEKGDGGKCLQSLPCSSLMTDEEVESIFEMLEESLSVLDNSSDSDNLTAKKFAKKINGKTHFIKGNALSEYRAILDLYKDGFSKTIPNLMAAVNIMAITKKQKIKDRESFLQENDDE